MKGKIKNMFVNQLKNIESLSSTFMFCNWQMVDRLFKNCDMALIPILSDMHA
jgi:hypothetical protein